MIRRWKLLPMLAIILFFLLPAPVYIHRVWCLENVPGEGDATIRSRELTGQVKEALQRHEFQKAYNLAQRAVALDPSNEEAKQLFVNIHVLIGSMPESPVKNKSVIDRSGRELKKKNSDISDASLDKMKEESGASPEEIREHLVSERSKPYIKLSFLYGEAESDYLNFIDTRAAFAGARGEAGYFFSFTGGHVGLSADYTLFPVKITGASEIDVVFHRFNACLMAREFFFVTEGSSLVLGLRAGYHYYYLENRKDKGVYYYRNAYGPSAGFFFSDPFFSRIGSAGWIKPFGIEGGVNCLPQMFNRDSLFILEYNMALTYNFSLVRFAFGWRSYLLSNGSVMESLSGIEIGVECRL